MLAVQPSGLQYCCKSSPQITKNETIFEYIQIDHNHVSFGIWESRTLAELINFFRYSPTIQELSKQLPNANLTHSTSQFAHKSKGRFPKKINYLILQKDFV